MALQLRSSRPIAILALGLFSVASGEAADPRPDASTIPPPIPWQEPAPLTRLFLQLPFEAPEVVLPRKLEVGLRLLYSNTLLSALNEGLVLDVHVETAQPTVLLRYGATMALSRSADLETGVVENVFSPYRGADITFLFGARARL